jgi:hypothetical protein
VNDDFVNVVQAEVYKYLAARVQRYPGRTDVWAALTGSLTPQLAALRHGKHFYRLLARYTRLGTLIPATLIKLYYILLAVVGAAREKK